MATDQSINDLLAAANEALIEAGYRTGDFAAARDLAGRARSQAASSGDPADQARALTCLGMVAHFENITVLTNGSKPGQSDIDHEERLFRQALSQWQQFSERGTTEHRAAEAGDTEPGDTEPGDTTGTVEAAGTDEADAADTDKTSDADETVGSTHAAGTAQALFGLGLVYQVLHQDWMTAMPYFWQALDLVSKPDTGADHYLRSEVHRHVGFYYLVEDVRPPEAVRHLQVSLELREELADPRRIPSALVALAQAESSAGNHDRAVDLLTRAVAEARAAGLMPQRIEDAEQALREAQAARAGTGDSATDAGAGTATQTEADSATDAEPDTPADPEPDTATDAEPSG